MTDSYYVRLSPTVRFKAPACYDDQIEAEESEKCILCPVRKQCTSGQPAELVAVPEVML